jgi:hypothetical protein
MKSDPEFTKVPPEYEFNPYSVNPVVPGPMINDPAPDKPPLKYPPPPVPAIVNEKPLLFTGPFISK